MTASSVGSGFLSGRRLAVTMRLAALLNDPGRTRGRFEAGAEEGGAADKAGCDNKGKSRAQVDVSEGVEVRLQRSDTAGDKGRELGTN